MYEKARGLSVFRQEKCAGSRLERRSRCLFYTKGCTPQLISCNRVTYLSSLFYAVWWVQGRRVRPERRCLPEANMVGDDGHECTECRSIHEGRVWRLRTQKSQETSLSNFHSRTGEFPRVENVDFLGVVVVPSRTRGAKAVSSLFVPLRWHKSILFDHLQENSSCARSISERIPRQG